jgi:hypothetical protein
MKNESCECEVGVDLNKSFRDTLTACVRHHHHRHYPMETK